MKKKSALKAIQRTKPETAKWLAMLGPCVDVPHGRRMARLVAYCAKVRALKTTVLDKRPSGKFRGERLVKRRIGPRLTALLFDALASLDPQPLENLAAIVRRMREHNQDPQDPQPTLPFQDKAMRLADVASLQGEPPLTQKQLLQRMGRQPKEHDAASYERRELKRLPITFAPGKRGRPKTATRKGRT